MVKQPDNKIIVDKEKLNQLITNAKKRDVNYSISLDHNVDCYIRLYKMESMLTQSNNESSRNKIINELLKEAIQKRMEQTT